MSTMVVLGFKNEDGASQALGWLAEAQKQKLIVLLDAAIVTRKQDGKPKIKQLHNLVAGGALGGAFWGHAGRLDLPDAALWSGRRRNERGGWGIVQRHWH